MTDTKPTKPKPKIEGHTVINAVLWLALLLALGSSVQHLAWTFGTVERHPLLGWLAAVAVDAGLAALAYSIQQRRRAGRSAKVLWVGVVLFALLSALANFYHALSVESAALAVESGGTFALASLAWIEYVKAGLLSATLPLMVLYLGEIISSDDAAQAEKVKAEAKEAADKAEREQAKAEREERKRLEAEQAAKVKAEQEAEAEDGAIPCPHCERTFKTLNALNAHARIHSNGKAVQSQSNTKS